MTLEPQNVLCTPEKQSSDNLFMLEASLKIKRVFVDFCFTAQKQIDLTIKSTFSNYTSFSMHTIGILVI